MGCPKATAKIGGQTMISRIAGRLAEQAATIVINANSGIEGFAETGLPVIPDIRRDIGTPLAGLHTALSFAGREGFEAVLTVPSDCPFLPPDLAARLQAAGRPAAIAASGGQAHYLTGLWSRDLLRELEAALAQPQVPRLQDWARQCGAALVAWSASPFDPFFNVNTPEELAEAERIAAEFSP